MPRRGAGSRAGKSGCVVCSVLLGLLLCVSGGCQSGPQPVDRARAAFYRGELAEARGQLTTIIEEQRRLQDVAKLDLAMVELADGNFTEAEALLRERRDLFDGRDPPVVLPATTSLLTDDRDTPYDTAGYEDVMIRVLLSLAALLRDSGDAEAYANQAQLLQTELGRRAEERGLTDVGQAYQPLALAPYVRGLIREASHRNYDDAARAYGQVAEWQPAFRFAGADLQRATEGVHSPPGHGVLYVFALVGRGPIRVEERATATSGAMMIAERLVVGNEGLKIPPTVAPIPIPRVVVPASLVQTVGIRVGGVAAGTTAPLTDVGRLATIQAEAELPWTLARGVVRRAAKKAMVSTGAKSLAGDSRGLRTGLSLLGTVWEATERADTRCWSLLPREIQVLRLELPVGTQRISANALGAGRELDEVSTEVEIVDGRNSYLLVCAPDDYVTAMCASR